MRAERRFAAMGSTAHVIVLGPDGDEHVGRAVARLADLERRWSRFRDDSEISWLNRSAGYDVVVSAETVLLVERALAGWRATDGCYDPTVLGALLQSGYTNDFSTIDVRDLVRVDPPLHLGAGGITVDAATRCVRLPEGVGFDPGGIGKGLAADVVLAELLGAGAWGACVNVGGDLCVGGTAPSEDGWRVDLDDPETGERFGQVVLRTGGVATSSPLRRHWTGPDGRDVHHLVDPRTGACARTNVRSTTVVAAAAWQAEVLTKAAILGELAAIERLGAAALVRERGRDHATVRWSDYANPEVAR